jgi:hypothetical protein
MLGSSSGVNIAISNSEILSRFNGVAAPLYLQQEGGAVRLGATGGTATGTKLHITDGVDASLATHGYLVLGLTIGTNIVMDNNEIIARDNGSASTLYLQNDGGTVQIGAHTTINHGGVGEVLRLDGVDPNIGFYQNGVNKSFLSQSGTELFMGNNVGRIHLDGTQVAIGAVNANAGAYKLTVSGKIICEEVKVELYAAWPDYVFDEEYQLTSIHELSSFISTNNHLPNIPKASEIEMEGLDLGEMNRKLLEKVEELTLYIIQLQDQIDDIKNDMND